LRILAQILSNANDAIREEMQGCLLKDREREVLLLKLALSQQKPASILLGPISVCLNSLLILKTNVKEK